MKISVDFGKCKKKMLENCKKFEMTTGLESLTIFQLNKKKEKLKKLR